MDDDNPLLSGDLRLCKENCDAAMFGKMLLKENEELHTEIESLKESLEQKRHELKTCLKQKAELEASCHEEIAYLQKQVADGEENLRTELEAKHTQEVIKLNRRLKELQSDLDQATSRETQMGSKVSELEVLLQERLNQSELITSRSLVSADDSGELHDQLNSLLNEVTSLKSQLIDKKTEAQSVTVECKMLQDRLVSGDEDLQEARRQCVWATNALEEMKTEKLELECLLESQKMQADSHNKKGNSIFSELDDRRVDAEQRLSTLREANHTLKEKLAVEKQQNQEYKRQISRLMLQASSGHVNSEYVAEIENKLSAARQEVRSLHDAKTQLQEQQKSKMQEMLDLKEDGGYTQYLVSLVDSKEQEIDRIKQELSFKSLQLLDETDRLLALKGQINTVERERDSMRCQNMKLTLKLEELKLKYEPDAVKKSGVLVVKRSETIPLDSDVMITETTLNESAARLNITEQKNATKPLVETSDNIPRRTTGSVTSKKNTSVTQCLNLKKKTVSISDNVEEFEVENEQGGEELRPKVKGTRLTAVKHLSKNSCTSSSNVNDCKSQ